MTESFPRHFPSPSCHLLSTSAAATLIWTFIISLLNYFHSLNWSCHPHLTHSTVVRMIFLKLKSDYASPFSSVHGILHFHPQELRSASFCGCLTPLGLICYYICLDRLFLRLSDGLLFIPQVPTQVVPPLWRQPLPQPTLFSTRHTLPCSCLLHLLEFFMQLQADYGWDWNHLRTCLVTCLAPGLRRLTAGTPQDASLSLYLPMSE